MQTCTFGQEDRGDIFISCLVSNHLTGARWKYNGNLLNRKKSTKTHIYLPKNVLNVYFFYLFSTTTNNLNSISLLTFLMIKLVSIPPTIITTET